MSKTNLMICNEVQQATILAALRFYQQSETRVCEAIEDIATNGGDFIAMTTEEIDHLCEEIVNVTSPAKEDVLSALVANGYTFSDVSTPFAVDSDTDPYAKAACLKVANEEGSIEVDGTTVISKGDDDGAYVMSWIWVSDVEAGVVSNSKKLTWLVECLDSIEQQSVVYVHRAWLEDTLANFSDEIDEIESEQPVWGEPTELQWQHDGQVHTFLASDALKSMAAAAKDNELLDEPDMTEIESFITTHGAKLDLILRSATITP